MREVKGGAKLNNIPLTCQSALELYGFELAGNNNVGGNLACTTSSTDNSQIPICHTFVKWAGGKRQLLSQLYPLAPPEFNGYFEPFLGGGALFFYLISNKELINVYVAIKDDVEKLIILLTQHKIEYNQAPEEYYYKLRNNY